MDGHKIIDKLNTWFDEGTMFTMASSISAYQTKKLIASGGLFKSEIHPNVIFKDANVRDMFDELFKDPSKQIFILDEISDSGFNNRYQLENAIQRHDVVKYKKLVKPVLFIKIN